MARRDLLLVDARGTGLSGALDCPAFRRTVDRLRLTAPGAARSKIGRAARLLRHARGGRRPRRRARRAERSTRSTCTATPTGPTSGRRSRSATATGCARWCSTAPTRCPAPIPRSATSRRRRGAAWRSCASKANPGCVEDPRAALTRVGGPRDPGRSPPAARGRNTDGKLIPVYDWPDLAGHGGAVGLRLASRSTATCPARCARSSTATGRRCCGWWPRRRWTPPASSPVRGFSDPLYLAVTCHDYPQLWLPRAVRRAPKQARRALAAQPPERFAPFTAAAWTSLDYEGASACLRGPAPRAASLRCRPARPTRPCRRSCSTASSTTSPTTPRRARRRVAVPARDVRGDREHRPHLGDQRPRRLRGAARPPFIPTLDAATPAARPGSPSSAASRASRAGGGQRGRRTRARRAQPAGAARGRRGGAHGRRRDPALGGQQRRRQPRAARRPLELHAATSVVAVPLPPRPLRARRRRQRHRHLAARGRRRGRAPAAARAAGGCALAGARSARCHRHARRHAARPASARGDARPVTGLRA